jgi:hypothetical protein
MFIRMDVETFITYKCSYEKYKKLFIQTVVLFCIFVLESYIVPLFNLTVEVGTFIILPLMENASTWIINLF